MRRSLSPDAPTPAAAILKDARFAWTDSPLGPICLLAGDDGLRACWLREHPAEALVARGRTLSGAGADARLRAAIDQLGEYFEGRRQTFDLGLAPIGTPFQMKVWAALRAIPFGQAISYANLAARCGSPKAFRAVGGANGRNPIPIIIPCHRVIAADGRIGGFSSGLDRKRAMLHLEGIAIKA